MILSDFQVLLFQETSKEKTIPDSHYRQNLDTKPKQLSVTKVSVISTMSARSLPPQHEIKHAHCKTSEREHPVSLVAVTKISRVL